MKFMNHDTLTHLAGDSYFEAFKRENRITNCEKGLFCDEILEFLVGFFKKMKSDRGTWKSLQDLLRDFSTYGMLSLIQSGEV